MKKNLTTLFLLSLAAMTNFCFSSEGDFFEESKKNCPRCTEMALAIEYDDLSNDYISRGEDLLLAGEFENAIEELQIGYELTSYGFKENRDINQMRSLFPMMIAYGHLEQIEDMLKVTNKMYSIMDSRSCSKLNYAHSNDSGRSGQCQPLDGPDRISINTCLDRVQGTERAFIALAAAIKKKGGSTIAVLAIQAIAEKARDCCYAGGLWKGCLIPLLNKYYSEKGSPIWFCY